jgi:surfeit locus 1 family protein
MHAMSHRTVIHLPFWPSVLVLSFLFLTLSLGFWQLRREAEKKQLEQLSSTALTQPPVELAMALASSTPTAYRVRLAGQWLSAPLLLLENQSWQGQRGWHVLQWLQLADGRQLLVDRGWSKQAPLPASGEVSVLGQLYQPGQPWRAPVVDLSQAVVLLPVLDLNVLRQNDPARLSMLLRLDADSAAVLQANWQTSTGMTPAKHRGYAVTWFSLSAVLVLMYGLWLVRQTKTTAVNASVSSAQEPTSPSHHD